MSVELNNPNSPRCANSDEPPTHPFPFPSKGTLTISMTTDNTQSVSGYDSSTEEGGNTTPGLVPSSAHPSIVAVHGSVPSSPYFHGVKLFIPGPRSSRRDTWDLLSPRPKDGGPEALEEVEEEVAKPDELGEDDNDEDEAKPLKKPNYRVIAIDFDDVMCQNVKALCVEHNKIFGTDLCLEDMKSYMYFQNRGWGKPADVARKMQMLANILPKTEPVPGFSKALRQLHALGHPLHIVTSRPESDKKVVTEWLAAQGITIGFRDEDVIAAAWFTDTYGAVNPDLPEKGDTVTEIAREDELNEKLRAKYLEIVQKKSTGKLKVLRAINAALFIDDHHGNLEPVLHAEPPIPCLLFGPWPWNRARSGASTPVELMSYEERESIGATLPREDIPMVEGLHRTKTWEDVIRWVRAWDEKDTA